MSVVLSVMRDTPHFDTFLWNVVTVASCEKETFSLNGHLQILYIPVIAQFSMILQSLFCGRNSIMCGPFRCFSVCLFKSCFIHAVL